MALVMFRHIRILTLVHAIKIIMEHDVNVREDLSKFDLVFLSLRSTSLLLSTGSVSKRCDMYIWCKR